MKRKMLAAMAAVMLMGSNVYADNLDDVLSALSYYSSTLKGLTYTETTYDKPVSTVEQWQNIIKTANQNLVDSITIHFENFNDSVYKLDLISDYNVSISAKGYTNGTEAYITYTFTYNANYKYFRAANNLSLVSKLSVEEKAVFAELYKKSNEIKAQYSTDYDRELAIHDYIVKNYSYPSGNNIEARQHTITGLVRDGSGVCESYATAFEVMCSLCNIDCQTVTGTLNGVAHMWNIVKLDGEYYHIDLTADDPSPDIPNTARYSHFNITTAEVYKDHTIETTVPMCTATKYNYFEYNDLIVHNKSELTQIINNALQSGKTTITFKTKGYIIDKADTIKNSFANKGFSTIAISGEYGKESTYFIVLK